MQSILQYRRFGKYARQQYERDQKRAEALEHGNTADGNIVLAEAMTHRNSSIGDTESPDPRDPEKAEQPIQNSFSNREERYRGEDLQRGRTTDTLETTQSFGMRMGHAMTGIEVRQLPTALTKTRTRRSWKEKGNKKDEKKEEKETVFVVGYESENDPLNPHKWSLTTRVSATILIASIGFVVGFASSVDSAALVQASEEFGVSEVTESLATGLFLVGFGFGALFAGPISETVGRNPVYIVTLFIYMIWISRLSLYFMFLWTDTHLHCSGSWPCPQYRSTTGFPLSSRVLWLNTSYMCGGFYFRFMGSDRARVHVPCVCKRSVHGTHFWPRIRWFHRTIKSALVALVRMDHINNVWLGPGTRRDLPARNFCSRSPEMESCSPAQYYGGRSVRV